MTTNTTEPCTYCGQSEHGAYQIDSAMLGDEDLSRDQLRRMACELEARIGIPCTAITDSVNGAHNCPELVSFVERRQNEWWAAIDAAKSA